MNEFRRVSGACAYRLRGSDRVVCLRHGISSWPFEEIFRHLVYEPPPAVARALEDIGSVLDLGGNDGHFGAWALDRYPGARIVAYEPDPTSAEVYERCIERNYAAERWSLVRAIASSRGGEQAFVALGTSWSRIAAAEEQRDTVMLPQEDVLPQIQETDFVKMDIEGGEWPILLDPRLGEGGTRAVVLEYHPHMCPGPVPRDEADRLLREAGFAVIDPGHSYEQFPPGQGMLWGVRIDLAEDRP
jgi:FkbM family methyltransferase